VRSRFAVHEIAILNIPSRAPGPVPYGPGRNLGADVGTLSRRARSMGSPAPPEESGGLRPGFARRSSLRSAQHAKAPVVRLSAPDSRHSPGPGPGRKGKVAGVGTQGRLAGAEAARVVLGGW
jgi:hypothetical protein